MKLVEPIEYVKVDDSRRGEGSGVLRIGEPGAAVLDQRPERPPQALLLAVAGQMKEIPDIWTPQELAAIVNDTIDLAKVRAVDIDALAADPNQPVGERRSCRSV